LAIMLVPTLALAAWVLTVGSKSLKWLPVAVLVAMIPVAGKFAAARARLVRR
jgi:hypothetical protein